MATLKRTMFREYDIRGKETEDELNDKSIYLIARGFGKMLRDLGVQEAVLGHDARGTSESFHAQARTALLESGINALDIGTVTTPMSYWAQFCFKTKGLCMITASHNPAGWNGLKLGTNLSSTLGPQEIKNLYAIIEKEDWATGKGTLRTEDIKDRYIQDVINRAKFAKKLKILVNTGNGTSGLFAPELFRRAGIEVVEHFTNVDPTYPNYTANPDGEKMMQDTGDQTVKNACDLGLAFDGDGDRLGVVDEKGQIVWPDRYLMLLSRLVLQKNPGAKIVFDVKVSEALPEDIQAHGGNPIMWITGHSYIKAKLAEENAALAGEMSGHIFFSDDYYGFDDAFFAGLKLLEYVSAQAKPLSELIKDTPYYVSTPTIQVQVTDEGKYKIVEGLVEDFKAEGAKMVTVNGARVYIGDGWGLVRASSNTPSLVLRFEAKTKEGLENIQQIFKNKLEKHGVTAKWDSSGH